jgi:NAD(P)-dependent dehydrogenase (short-subunit alcohol dehydrogenase family)
MMLDDKVVVVTGGAGLLGSAFSEAIISENAIVIIADYDKIIASKCATNLTAKIKTGFAEAHSLDITSKSSINELIANVHKKYGKIDALINNAYPRNKNYGNKFEDVTYQDFCENLTSNVGGYFLTSQQFIHYFKKQGYGNIINIASIYGVIAPRFDIYQGTDMTTPVEYAAIKAAILHLTRYMAKYLSGKNIKVNSLSPGGIKNHQPAKFIEKYASYTLNQNMLDATDINGALLFLLSGHSAHMNGQNVIIDDGFTL